MIQESEHRVEYVLRRILDVSMWLCAIIVVAMMAFVVKDVFQRYFFGSVSRWMGDMIVNFFLVYLTLLPAAWLLLQDGHVSVELFVSRLSTRRRRTFGLAMDILGLAYSAILTWQGWLLAWDALVNGFTFPVIAEFPKFPAFVVIPVGGGLLCFAFALRILNRCWRR